MGADTPRFGGSTHGTRWQRLSWWLQTYRDIWILVAATLVGGVLTVLITLGGPQGALRPREIGTGTAMIRALERGLGFTAENVNARSRHRQPVGFLVITEVGPNGAIAEAGIRPGDRILYPYADGFYKSLAFGRGRTIEVPIQRGRERLTAYVYVPKIPLPSDPAGVRWVCPDSIVSGR